MKSKVQAGRRRRDQNKKGNSENTCSLSSPDTFGAVNHEILRPKSHASTCYGGSVAIGKNIKNHSFSHFSTWRAPWLPIPNDPSELRGQSHASRTQFSPTNVLTQPAPTVNQKTADSAHRRYSIWLTGSRVVSMPRRSRIQTLTSLCGGRGSLNPNFDA